QLGRRLGEAEVAGGDLEGAQRGQRRGGHQGSSSGFTLVQLISGIINRRLPQISDSRIFLVRHQPPVNAN
ncbi:MAG TPA: hypothetical protein VKP12_12080, partial [Kiloniellaceae bacterium]|nr:hypothetical protein [Kiloniellaceae bacterium]